jgi:hypothetical protein
MTVIPRIFLPSTIRTVIKNVDSQVLVQALLLSINIYFIIILADRLGLKDTDVISVTPQFGGSKDKTAKVQFLIDYYLQGNEPVKESNHLNDQLLDGGIPT